MANKTALVLGATGGIGGEMARHLDAAGWQVRALHRDVARVARGKGTLDWRQGDALQAADVADAAAGVALIVHAVNPPGYRNWGQLVLPMIDNTIAAARASGARILMPGTIYNYGLDAFPSVSEDAPQRATTAKGAIRIELERRLRAAASDGVRTLVVRAGDFFGPHAANNWFSQAMVKPGKPVTAITTPSLPGVGHQWAYLPDLAATMMQLLARDAELDAFATFHLDGHWDADGTAMIGAIRRAIGRPDLPVRRLPWWLIALASPMVPFCRELNEVRYFWQHPMRLDNSRLKRFLGHEPHTPLDDAVHATLKPLIEAAV